LSAEFRLVSRPPWTPAQVPLFKIGFLIFHDRQNRFPGKRIKNNNRASPSPHFRKTIALQTQLYRCDQSPPEHFPIFRWTALQPMNPIPREQSTPR
jgi:hypothetical protein